VVRVRQPCRCLCRAVELQMTITRRLRRMTRHLSQIGLTLGLTFTDLILTPRWRAGGLLVVVRYL
jgi:hypothetical protein